MKLYQFLPAIALILFGAGCSSTTPATTDTGSVQDSAAALTQGKSAKQVETEIALGISLPPNTEIISLIENKKAIGVVGRLPLSLIESTDFFSKELGSAGYQPARNWGASPYDNEINKTASFKGSGEIWAFILSQEGKTTTFDLQRQL